MKARLFYILACGLIFGVIVHIVIILLIPNLGSRDAAKQIASSFTEQKFHFIDSGKKLDISNADPHLKLSVCKFNLENNAIEIKGPKISNFWSVSVFDERGRVIYSMNDRTAIKNTLNMIIVNPIQMADIRQLQPEELESSILVESQNSKGFVILRALIANPSWQASTIDFLNKAQCNPYITNSFLEVQ